MKISLDFSTPDTPTANTLATLAGQTHALQLGFARLLHEIALSSDAPQALVAEVAEAMRHDAFDPTDPQLRIAAEAAETTASAIEQHAGRRPDD